MLFDQYPPKSGFPSGKRGIEVVDFASGGPFVVGFPLAAGIWAASCIDKMRIAAKTTARQRSREFMVISITQVMEDG